MKKPTANIPFRKRLAASTIAVTAVVFTSGSWGQQPTSAPAPQWSGPTVPADAAIKSGAFAKVGAQLAHLQQEYATYLQQGGMQTLGAFHSSEPAVVLIDSGVLIDAVAAGDAKALFEDLKALGLQNGVAYGRTVSGTLPLSRIKAMAALPSLQFARPAMMKTNAGSVTSQGDPAMRSDMARTTLGVSGAGIKVGVLSDSFNCLGGAAADVASGDLPAAVSVLQEGPCPASDEGRAMMQLIHDVAPGADLAFRTAWRGPADFAQGIIDLRNAGASIIVDDVGYFHEPFFQDGIIAHAVNAVKASGVSYFSSAGNAGRKSYESNYRPSGVSWLGDVLHDFDPGPGVSIFQQITLPPGGTTISFQWDEPYFSVSGPPGSASDYDLFVCPTPVLNLACLGVVDLNVGKDPIEVLPLQVTGGPLQAYLAIGRFAGSTSNSLKYIAGNSSFTVNTFNTNSSTLFGHANAAGAEAVGAAWYHKTPRFGTAPPVLESFSSAGGTPILFNTAGMRIAPIFRAKPEIVAPDGTNTTFFGEPSDGVDLDAFPNFFGTSAAAPHAAGVAALLLQSNPTWNPDQIYGALEGTAIDMKTPGFDFDSGYGLVAAIPDPTPMPQIQANGSDGPITITPTDALSIKVQLTNAHPQNVDWWMVAKSPSGDWHYYVHPHQWIVAGPSLANVSFAHQGPVFNLNPFQVLSATNLQPGTHRFYFGVDLNMNGLLDMDQVYYDSVEVNVQ